MITAYQHDARGYYLYPFKYPAGPIPAGCVADAPPENEGFIPKWTGATWELVENHKSERGWINGEPFEIKDYGPYPEGWSSTPPAPTMLEQVQAVQAKYHAVLNTLSNAYTTATILEDGEEASAIQAEYNNMLKRMETEIATLLG